MATGTIDYSVRSTTTIKSIYDRPQYYHAAFDYAGECEMEIISRYAPQPPGPRILEPACGSGRLLLALGQQGYGCLGYDLSTEMVMYTRLRVHAAELDHNIMVIQGDMRRTTFDHEFDLAFNAINSIGYLLTDDDILAHLRNTAKALKPGGTYLVHLGTASNQHSPDDNAQWDVKGENISGTVTWGVEREDHDSKLSYQYCLFDIVDNGTPVRFRDEHLLRLWLLDDLRALITQSGCFELEAIFSDDCQSVPLDTSITGEMGNHWYVLRSTL